VPYLGFWRHWRQQLAAVLSAVLIERFGAAAIPQFARRLTKCKEAGVLPHSYNSMFGGRMDSTLSDVLLIRLWRAELGLAGKSETSPIPSEMLLSAGPFQYDDTKLQTMGVRSLNLFGRAISQTNIGRNLGDLSMPCRNDKSAWHLHGCGQSCNWGIP
jgi:hypothetical protein